MLYGCRVHCSKPSVKSFRDHDAQGVVAQVKVSPDVEKRVACDDGGKGVELDDVEIADPFVRVFPSHGWGDGKKAACLE